MMKNYAPVIGMSDRILYLMEKKNLSTAKLAKMIGIDRATLCGYLVERRCMNTSTLYEICKALNVSADYLMFGDEK